MLTSSPSSHLPSPLPSPPTAHAEMPKLRLRARKEDVATGAGVQRRRVVKRQPPRGANKRRRADDDEMSREDANEEDSDEETQIPGPSTPKRMRLAPEVLPLGLERADFHDLKLQEMEHKKVEVDDGEKTDVNGEDEWSTEEDRILVELVLEKLRLTKSDWQDCARSLGKGRGDVGRRWKSLMANGEVGLKRRGRIHGTWR